MTSRATSSAARSCDTHEAPHVSDPRRFNRIDWLIGGALAAACFAVYCILRPPLYDYDGYTDRLWALLPDPWYNANPHHLLFNDWQMLLAGWAEWLGHPGTVPFQIVGIAVGCASLFLFFLLLLRVTGSRLFAGVSVTFLAFTPSFWFVTLQNHADAIALVFLVMYFLCWQSAEGELPSFTWLAAAGACLVVAALFHQALVLFIVPAAAVLLFLGGKSLRVRLFQSSAWAIAVSIPILALYIWFWQNIDPQQSLIRWSGSYAEELHPPQILQMGLISAFARAVAGFSGSLIQSAWLKASLANHLSKSQVYFLYTLLGLALLGGTLFYLGRSRMRGANVLLSRKPFFVLSALSTLVWWLFALSWEGATEHYWLLGTIPLLVCIGEIVKEDRWRGLSAFVIAAVIASGWNLYANQQIDREYSIYFPEPGLRAIAQCVAPNDIFLVLSSDVHREADYGLLIDILKANHSAHGISIADDLIAPETSPQNWQSALKGRINSTLAAGGRVYIASHLFDKDDYIDLANENDPFAEQTKPQLDSVDSEKLYQQVTGLLAAYPMKPSRFRIGSDDYSVIDPGRGLASPDKCE